LGMPIAGDSPMESTIDSGMDAGMDSGQRAGAKRLSTAKTSTVELAY
jgi:hypothetical protein